MPLRAQSRRTEVARCSGPWLCSFNSAASSICGESSRSSAPPGWDSLRRRGRPQEFIEPVDGLRPGVARRLEVVCRAGVIVKSVADALIDAEAEGLLHRDHRSHYWR